MNKNIIRYQNILVTSGWGMIILGIWPLLAALMLIYLMPRDLNNAVESFSYEALTRSTFIAIYLIIVGIDLLFRILAGYNAIREGKGRKINSACIVYGIITLVVTIVLCYLVCVDIFSGMGTIIEWVDIIITLFMIFVNIELLVSAIKLKSARRKLQSA